MPAPAQSAQPSKSTPGAELLRPRGRPYPLLLAIAGHAALLAPFLLASTPQPMAAAPAEEVLTVSLIAPTPPPQPAPIENIVEPEPVAPEPTPVEEVARIEPPEPEPAPPPPPEPRKPKPKPKPEPKPVAKPQPTPQPEPEPRKDPSPPPPAPAAQATPEPAPAREEPARFDAAYLNNPRPNYPKISRRLGEEGTVYLRAHVLPDGSPEQVRIDRSSGSERLDEAALDAVRKWRFVPAKRGTSAVPAWVVIPITFNLES